MKKHLILFIACFPLISLAEEVDCKNALTTLEINYCSGQEVETSELQLTAYLSKAKEKYADEKEVVLKLESAQSAWLDYRKAHCDAIYEVWSGGTIRGAMFNGCMLALTKERTHTLWQDYLTFMDSTPPLLPEPR